MCSCHEDGIEEDTAEGGAGRQLATATHSRTPAAGSRTPHPLPSPVPDALSSGVHVSSEHREAHIGIVERAAALTGLAAGGTHEHELALVVERVGEYDAEAKMMERERESA